MADRPATAAGRARLVTEQSLADAIRRQRHMHVAGAEELALAIFTALPVEAEARQAAPLDEDALLDAFRRSIDRAWVLRSNYPAFTGLATEEFRRLVAAAYAVATTDEEGAP